MANAICKKCGKETKHPVVWHPACWETVAGGIAEKFCDNYCRFPRECKTQDELDEHCGSCDMIKLVNLNL